MFQDLLRDNPKLIVLPLLGLVKNGEFLKDRWELNSVMGLLPSQREREKGTMLSHLRLSEGSL
jgi:hypothetical protein